MNSEDPILGFFVRWVQEFAKHCEKVTVICLEKGLPPEISQGDSFSGRKTISRGNYDLPENVKVLTLGKERGNTKFDQLMWFYQHIWDERKNYDAVFVHMNQEYVLLGVCLWKSLKKKVYMWRNHAKGNILTMLAAKLSDKVFYTSPSSHTAKFPNAVQMPVGIDTDFFKPDPKVKKVPNSILFLGRIGPVKRVLEFVDRLGDFEREGKVFSATIAGEALEGDKAYEQKVRERVATYGIENKVKFIGPVNREEALKLYQLHETYVNMTSAGSFDKTIFEAASCGTVILVENKDLKDLEKKNGEKLRKFVIDEHGLSLLGEKIVKNFNESLPPKPSLLRVFFKRFLTGFYLGDGLKEKVCAAFGLVFISRLSQLSFFIKENGIKAKVYIKNGSDAAMFTEVFYDKEYRLPPPVNPKKILDLGANVGFASLYFSLNYPDAQIVAIEPDPNNLKTLELNLSNRSNIRIIPSAIDVVAGNRDLYIQEGIGMSSSFFSFPQAQKVTVSSTTVKKVLSDMNWNKADLIKFDIEGAEWELFQDSPDKLAEFFIGEYHEDIVKKPVSEFIALFKDFKADMRPLSKNRHSLFLSKN